MPDTHLSIRDLITICLNGNIVHADGGKAIAFYILMPIGYLLLLSAVLLVVYRFYRYVFHVVCAAFLLLIFILNAHGVDNGNLELLTIGLVGLLCGFVSTEKINGMVRHSYVLTGAYLAYTAAISIWNVPYLLQIVGVGLSVIMLYMLGAWSGSSGTVAQQIILLGKYSLYGYIAQIVILQVLHRGLRRFDLGIGLLSISFVAACGLTMISVMAVDRARARAGAVNWLYKAVFA
jgi:hypothetical protein